MTTVMVTGGTGYLGQALLPELLAAGIGVRALVRDPTRLPRDAGAGVTAVEGDLLEPASLLRAAQGADAVLHLAGEVSDWCPDPARFQEVNVQGTRNVLAAARAAGVRQLLLTSSVMVLGHTDGLGEASETTQRPYGSHFLAYQRTKAEALRLCRASRGPELDVRVVFPGALYGPGPLTDGNYLARVMHELETGGFPLLPRTAGRRWCLTHVEDVAHGHVLALTRGARGGEYILGGDNVSFDRMLAIMRDGLALSALPPRVPGWLMLGGLSLLCLGSAVAGRRPPISMGGGRALLHDWAFSSRRAELELGYRWQPFEEAFPRFVRWYAEGGRRLSAARAGSAARP